MIVAVPKFKDEIAPCFEVASTFVITTYEGDNETEKSLQNCEGCEGFGRVRLLNEYNVNVLICNGIKAFYKDILANSGVTVIDKVTLPVEEALKRYYQGNLKAAEIKPELLNIDSSIPLDDIICWTKDLFQTNGYKISKVKDSAPFPIDLVAEITCPVCRKPIRVAICCGAHSYRIDQDLLEFHRVAATDYHAQVYVHPAQPEIARRCDEFGIELIDPLADFCEIKRKSKKTVPVLKKPAAGHEKAWQ